eukprot:Tbor_TRINITY_DN3105_c0_g1::TRINITY_DN3105_c0_g1_i1::g.14770::m.14770
MFSIPFRWVTKGTLRRIGAISTLSAIVSGFAQQAVTSNITRESSLFSLFNTTVFCKSIETPEYLIMYYLRSSRARFRHYATVIEEDGSRAMNANDFICAVLACKDRGLLANSEVAGNDIDTLFKMIDSDGNGTISVSEFSFLMTMLGTTKEDFKFGFFMFNEQGHADYTLSFNEFNKMMQTFGDEHFKLKKSNIIVKRMFGSNADQLCSFEKFENELNELKTKVMKVEFNQYDPDNTGVISPGNFGKLMANNSLGIHLPFYIVDNIRKMNNVGDTSSSSETVGIPFSAWKSFSTVIEKSEALCEAVHIYTCSGAVLRKADFNRAVTAVGLPMMSEQEVHLIFSLFDRNGDGNLEYDEFFSIVKNKSSYNIRSQINKREKSHLYPRFVKCGGQALFS